MAEAASAPAAGRTEADPELARLAREIDTAGYWAEHLILCADIIAGGVLDSRLPCRDLADGQALQFCLEEGKCSINRLREASDALARRLGVSL